MTRLHHSQFNHLVEQPGENAWLLYNFATRNLIRLDALQKAVYDSAPLLPTDAPVVQKLLEQGFLASRNEALYACARMRDGVRARARGELRRPLVLTIAVTSACNFACPYCFQRRRAGHMSTEVQDAVVRFVAERLATGNFTQLKVGWFGGEPLLAANVIENLSVRLIALAKEYGMPYRAMVNTNGYLLNQDAVDLLERCDLHHVLVTVDGVGTTHDATRHLRGGGPTYQRIIENLSSIHTSMSINVRCNLHAGNATCFDELADAVEGIAQATGNEMYCVPARVERSVANVERGYEVSPISDEQYRAAMVRTGTLERRSSYLPRTTQCPAVRLNELYIDEQGNLFPNCHPLAEEPDHAFGNICDPQWVNSIDWNEMAEEVIRRYTLLDDYPRCLTCKLLVHCWGGCAARRLPFGEEQCPKNTTDPDGFVQSLWEQRNHPDATKDPESFVTLRAIDSDAM